ncbi:MAG TPA: A/G-specific adenine glycosylase [Gemmatimonadota bacterium]
MTPRQSEHVGVRRQSGRGKGLPGRTGERVFASRLLRWYDARQRDLPWRRSRTPYRTLVSEIMLQQTRVATATPYYRRFLRRFPSFAALSRADEQDVLTQWEGLGYYRRARNLLRTARLVTARGGRLPRSAAELRTLPGIGPYTAAAVASVAFGEPEPVLDGNVERVAARLVALEAPPARARPALRELLRALLPPGRPGDFNQALMELGATVCTPRRPHCPACPVRTFCRAAALGRPEAYPRRRPRAPAPVRAEDGLLLGWQRRLLLRRRPREGLLGGLWSLPTYPAAPNGGGRSGTGAGARPALRRLRAETGIVARCTARLPPVRHVYSHFRLVLTPLVCEPASPPPPPVPDPFAWVSTVELPLFPMGKADRLAVAALMKVSS